MVHETVRIAQRYIFIITKRFKLSIIHITHFLKGKFNLKIVS